MADSTLMRVFQKTEEDLVANRDGRLTAAQRERSRKATGDDATFMAGFAIVFALVMGGVLALIVSSGKLFDFSEGISFDEVMILLVAGGLPLSALFWAVYTIVVHRRSAAIDRVDIIEGSVTLRIIRHRRLVLREVRVEGRTFALTEAAYDALEDGAHYRVYAVPLANVVVGIETSPAGKNPPTS